MDQKPNTLMLEGMGRRKKKIKTVEMSQNGEKQTTSERKVGQRYTLEIRIVPYGYVWVMGYGYGYGWIWEDVGRRSNKGEA